MCWIVCLVRKMTVWLNICLVTREWGCVAFCNAFLAPTKSYKWGLTGFISCSWPYISIASPTVTFLTIDHFLLLQFLHLFLIFAFRWPHCCQSFSFPYWASWALAMSARFGHQHQISDQISKYMPNMYHHGNWQSQQGLAWTKYKSQFFLCIWLNTLHYIYDSGTNNSIIVELCDFSSKCIFKKSLLHSGPYLQCWLRKKIRFDLSVEMRYNQDSKNEMWYLADMFFISLSLKLIQCLVLDFVPDTRATVDLAYKVYTVTDLKGY